MQLIDLHKQFSEIEDTIRKGIDQVLRHKKFIMGPEVAQLEDRLADYLGVKHAITCSNGTDALVLALRYFGLTKSDAVFVPSFSFLLRLRPFLWQAERQCLSIAMKHTIFVPLL